MRREIGQVRELLRDAIEKLSDGFMRIDAVVAERSRDAGLAAEVRKQAADVVTTLQFQDMVDQLLNHTLKRLDVIEQHLAGRRTSGGGEPAEEGSRLSASKPVAQRQMDPGDVDLF